MHGKIDEEKHSWTVGLQKQRSGNTTLKINGEDGNKIADLAHLLPMQVITPEGLTLLNGGPSYRRAFLDWGLFHQQSDFYPQWVNLKRLLKQRNAALQQVQNYNELKHWDIELVKTAQNVTAMRTEYAAAITSEIARHCAFFLPELEISVGFYQGWEKGADYTDILQQGFERDRSLGYTNVRCTKSGFPLPSQRLACGRCTFSRAVKALNVCLTISSRRIFNCRERETLYFLD